MKKVWLLFSCSLLSAQVPPELVRLQKAYPQQIKEISDDSITWHDGTVMPAFDGSPLDNQLEHCRYKAGKPRNTATYTPPQSDPRCSVFEPFFKKMYGSTPKEVEQHLVYVDWLPRIFGKGMYKVRVTTINDINKKVAQISNDLEHLVIRKPWIKPFLAHPAGGYNWRNVAHTNHLSNHSFGIALDINAALSNYWQWDLKKTGHPIDQNTVPPYHNKIPWEIALIFEKYGFTWGGKWYHYDTMHFEYRPELVSAF